MSVFPGSPRGLRADLPASAGAVSRLALQDHAELLEEEHEGAALLPGNTPSPPGEAAVNKTVIPRLLIYGIKTRIQIQVHLVPGERKQEVGSEMRFLEIG